MSDKCMIESRKIIIVNHKISKNDIQIIAFLN